MNYADLHVDRYPRVEGLNFSFEWMWSGKSRHAYLQIILSEETLDHLINWGMLKID